MNNGDEPGFDRRSGRLYESRSLRFGLDDMFLIYTECRRMKGARKGIKT